MARRRQLALVGATTVGLWALSSFLPRSFPRGVILQGAAFGAGVGLLAIGLVLTYRTTRVINFAYGAMGSAAAELGVATYQHRQLPWWACVAIAIVGGAVVGFGVDLLMRRFANSSRLIVTVATVGVMQVLVGLQFGISFWSHTNPLIAPFRTELSKTNFLVERTVFTANDLIAVAFAPIAVVTLSWFLSRTESGIAVRAIADNLDRARLLGLPIRRLSRLVWVLVGVLAAAVMILNAPTNGLPSDPFVATGGLFMPALAAAVIAKMDDLTSAFAVGVGLGVLDAIVSYNVQKEALTTVALLVVILAALIARRWQTTRVGADEASWALSATSRPLPPALSRLPEVKAGRVFVITVIALAVLGFPLVAPPGQVHTVAGYLVLGTAVLSLVVLSGWSGMVSLGQLAIVGVGAVVAGNLIVTANLDLFLALIVAALVAAVVSVLIGLPALRVRPIFLAVTTLAFATAMNQYFLNPTNYPNLIPASILRPVLWKRFPLDSERTMYYLCAGILVAAIIVVQALHRSRPGRILKASRDNPRAAAALTVPIVRTRLAGMIVAGMIAGIAGGLWAVLQDGVGASSFPTQDSVILFSMAMVGGLASVSGSLAGVALTELLVFGIGRLSSQGAQFSTLGTGALLLLVLVAFPGGLTQLIEEVRDRIIKRVAARRGIEWVVGAADGSKRTLPSRSLPSVAAASAGSRSASMLSCRNLVASYGPLQVLFGVDLDISEHEIVALLGTNGAGKSTIFKAVTGLIPSQGQTAFRGAPIAGKSADAIARTGLGMMPGGRGIFPSLSVAENLRLGSWPTKSKGAAGPVPTEELLDMFPALRARHGELAGNLSGGEQQQLSLAMAFASRPKLLLIDELSLGLAPAMVAQLCDKVRQIHSTGTTVVVVEQSLSVALQLADRAIFLEKGAVRFEGKTADLLGRKDLLRAVFIGGSGAGSTNGRQAKAESRSARSSHPGLVCNGITKHFGGVLALDGIDLTVEPGQIVGLIGHNGAGKTTLFDIISGFQRPSRGSVFLGDLDLTDAPAHIRAAEGIGRSFQEARLFPSLSVAETILAALDRHLASHDWVAAALKGPASVASEIAGHHRAGELIELLGLGGYASTPIADLSTGTRRIVELACVLAMGPSVVLLDEPSAGVAQREAEALAPLLRKVQAETGSAILIIEHDMVLLSSLCDKLVALEEGTVLCAGTPSEVLANPRVIQSYLGTDRQPPRGQTPKRTRAKKVPAVSGV